MKPASKQQKQWAANISKRTEIPLPKEDSYEVYYKWIAENKDVPDAPTVRFNEPEYGEAYMVISIKHMPKHCGQCEFWLNNEWYDEDAYFGDGIMHECPFGASHWGCLVERPSNCPLKAKINKENNNA